MVPTVEFAITVIPTSPFCLVSPCLRSFAPLQLPSTLCTHSYARTHGFLRFLSYRFVACFIYFFSRSLSRTKATFSFMCSRTGLSLVRWMCAFPGQMSLLLLCVPGSHFNTRPACLAWRAMGKGIYFYSISAETCVLWSSPHWCSHLFWKVISTNADWVTNTQMGSLFKVHTLCCRNASVYTHAFT